MQMYPLVLSPDSGDVIHVHQNTIVIALTRSEEVQVQASKYPVLDRRCSTIHRLLPIPYLTFTFLRLVSSRLVSFRLSFGLLCVRGVHCIEGKSSGLSFPFITDSLIQNTSFRTQPRRHIVQT